MRKWWVYKQKLTMKPSKATYLFDGHQKSKYLKYRGKTQIREFPR